MEMKKQTHIADLLFTLALFLVFAASAVMALLFGANVYQKDVYKRQGLLFLIGLHYNLMVLEFLFQLLYNIPPKTGRNDVRLSPPRWG